MFIAMCKVLHSVYVSLKKSYINISMENEFSLEGMDSPLLYRCSAWKLTAGRYELRPPSCKKCLHLPPKMAIITARNASLVSGSACASHVDWRVMTSRLTLPASIICYLCLPLCLMAFYLYFSFLILDLWHNWQWVIKYHSFSCLVACICHSEAATVINIPPLQIKTAVLMYGTYFLLEHMMYYNYYHDDNKDDIRVHCFQMFTLTCDCEGGEGFLSRFSC